MAYNDYKVTRSDGVAVGDLGIGLDTYHSTFYAAYIEGLKACAATKQNCMVMKRIEMTGEMSGIPMYGDPVSLACQYSPYGLGGSGRSYSWFNDADTVSIGNTSSETRLPGEQPFPANSVAVNDGFVFFMHGELKTGVATAFTLRGYIGDPDFTNGTEIFKVALTGLSLLSSTSITVHGRVQILRGGADGLIHVDGECFIDGLTPKKGDLTVGKKTVDFTVDHGNWNTGQFGGLNINNSFKLISIASYKL